MDPSLTVVLPIHNAERTLRRDVAEVLEAAAELTSRVELLILDDASRDDSFEVATELATTFPQVRVLRRSSRHALQQTLGEVRASIKSDVVIVHDGASRVNAEQLRLIWRQQQVLGAVRDDRSRRDGVSFADLRRPSITQPAMEAAHRRLMGFQPIGGEAAEAASQPDSAIDANRRRDEAGEAASRGKRGIGAIPATPRHGVFGSIADFALGE